MSPSHLNMLDTASFYDHYVYSIAIDLNNIGIRLLEGRRYRQAVEIFGNAVNAMHIVAENVFGRLSDPGQMQSIVQEPQQWLREAYALVANCDPDSTDRGLVCSHINLGILTYSCGGMQASTIRDFLLESPIFFVRRQNACIFRIDSHESSFGRQGGTTSVDIESSIVLHNLGIACFCRATVCATDLSEYGGAWYMEASFRILKLSYSIVQTLQFPAAQASPFVPHVADEDVLPLFITMVISLGKMASMRGTMHEILVYEAALARLTIEFSLAEHRRAQYWKNLCAAAA